MTLRWDVINVRSLVLRGEGIDRGVMGLVEHLACPGSRTTYRLDITDQNGRTQPPSVTIAVN